MTFEDIKAELAHGRKGIRKLGNNTYLVKLDGDKVGFRYHQTDVAIFEADKVELTTGGWFTSTTKERLSWALNVANIQAGGVSSRKKVWYVGDIEFFNGIQFDYNGKCLNAKPPTPKISLRDESMKELLDTNDYTLTQRLKEGDNAAKAIIAKLINRYITGLNSRIESGTLENGGSGECWYCSMRGKDGETVGGFFKDIDHLVSHLKERYYMVSLIYNALEARGYAYPEIFIAKADPEHEGKGKFDIETVKQHKEIVTRAVRHYFEQKLLNTPTEVRA